MIGLVLVSSCENKKVSKTYTYDCKVSDVDLLSQETIKAIEDGLFKQGVPLNDASIQEITGNGNYDVTATADADQHAIKKYLEWNKLIKWEDLKYNAGESFNYTLFRINKTSISDTRRVVVSTSKYLNTNDYNIEYRYTCEVTGIESYAPFVIENMKNAIDAQGVPFGDKSEQIITGIGKTEALTVHFADSVANINYKKWVEKVDIKTLPFLDGQGFNYVLFRERMPITEETKKDQVKSTTFTQEKENE